MNPPQEHSAQQEKYFEANGIHIHYEEYGSGYPLLLLHGGTANCESWSEHIPFLSQHFRVIAPDTRGHGKTDNPTGALSYSVLADDVAAFIQALGLTKPLVFGFSDGGQIALEMGIHHPEAAGVVVLGGTVYQFAQSYFDMLTGMGFAEAGKIDTEEMERSDPGWITYLQRTHARVGDPDYWKTLIRQISMLWWKPPVYTIADLHKITAPTLILTGDRDEGGSLEQTLELYRGIPDSELAVIPNADHGSTVNALSMGIVVDFLLRHIPSG